MASTSFELDVRNSGALSGGSTVTISGLNFGSYSFTATASATGVDLCSTASWSSATTLQCLMVAPKMLTRTHAKVTVGGVVGTRASKYFTFDGMICWCRDCLVAWEAVWTMAEDDVCIGGHWMGPLRDPGWHVLIDGMIV